MSIATPRPLAVIFCCVALPVVVGCQWLKPDDRFDDASFGEYGQSLRATSEDSGEKWGVNGRSQQIEANLGL